MIPKCDLSQLPVIRAGDILYIDPIITKQKQEKIELEIGSHIKRRALVIPREMVKIGKLDFDTTSSVGIIEREVKTKLISLIEPNLDVYQAKAQSNQAYHGLVLSCFMILDPEVGFYFRFNFFRQA